MDKPKDETKAGTPPPRAEIPNPDLWLRGEDSMKETMERVARDDYYEMRGKRMSAARARVQAVSNELGINLSPEELSTFSVLLVAIEE